MNRKILIIATALSVIVSAAYACQILGPVMSYSYCRQIALVGLPGILMAAAVSIALLGGHGGGPLGILLVIATLINFVVYAVLIVIALWVGRFFRKQN